MSFWSVRYPDPKREQLFAELLALAGQAAEVTVRTANAINRGIDEYETRLDYMCDMEFDGHTWQERYQDGDACGYWECTQCGKVSLGDPTIPMEAH
jgi:hypothetical protein